MLLLLLLEPLNPLLPGLLLAGEHVLQRLDFLLQLLLRNLKLPLYGSLLDLDVLVCPLELYDALVEVLDLLRPLVQLLVLVTDHVLKATTPLLLLCQLQLRLVTHLICQVQLLDGVVEVEFASVVLLLDLLMLDLEGAVE